MNKRLLLVSSLLCVSKLGFAVDPVQGWYFDLMAGVTYAPNVNFITTIFYNFPNEPAFAPLIPRQGTLTYKPQGTGSFGIGYRLDNFRYETELTFGSVGFDKFRLGSYAIRAGKQSFGYRLHGTTSVFGAFFNAFYDLYTPDPTTIYGVVPYVGLGAGYGIVKNTLNFYYYNVLLAGDTYSGSSGAFMGHAILGINYFLDDYTTVGIDARYMSTTRNSILDSSFKMGTVNLTINSAFDWPTT